MKLDLLILFLSFLGVAGFTQGIALEVHVTNIQSQKGVVQLALYGSEKDFLKKPIKTLTLKIAGNSIMGTFEGITPGEYAVSSFHDENENEKLDTNWIGVPSEPYGFSNNVRGLFGPPSFREARVAVKEGTNLIEFNLK